MDTGLEGKLLFQGLERDEGKQSLRRATQKVKLAHSIFESFSAKEIAALIEVIREKQVDIESWPIGFELKFEVAVRSFYDGSNSSECGFDINYLDESGEKRHIGKWIGEPFRIQGKLAKHLRTQIDFVTGLALFT
jgi:hypothetical protein